LNEAPWLNTEQSRNGAKRIYSENFSLQFHPNKCSGTKQDWILAAREWSTVAPFWKRLSVAGATSAVLPTSTLFLADGKTQAEEGSGNLNAGEGSHASVRGCDLIGPLLVITLQGHMIR
jgi:hypothetical protein